MRAAPAAQFTLGPQHAPRRLAVALQCLALGGMVAWLLLRLEIAGLTAAVGSLASMAALWLVAARPRQRALLLLRWDGSGWHRTRLGEPDEQAGEMVVLIDMGSWMLLRFRGFEAADSQWMSAQKASLGPHWHAFRCAVYSPRPAASPDASVEEAAL